MPSPTSATNSGSDSASAETVPTEAAPSEAADTETVRTGTVQARPGHSRSGSSWLTTYAGVLLLVVLVIVFSLGLGGRFLSWANLTGVVANLAISGIVALGLLIPLAAGVFDLSIGGTMSLGAIGVCALFMHVHHIPIVLAVLIVLLGGVLVGLANSYLVIAESVDPFIATIGMSSVLLGISEWISGGQTLATGIPTRFVTLGRQHIGHIPMTLVYALILGVAVWYLMAFTPLGRRIYATGANREAAHLSGVRTRRVLVFAFVASAVFAAFAGIVYAAQLGAGPSNVGSPFLLPAFSAAFLGSTIIQPGRFNVPGLLVAMLIVGIGINGLQLAGISFWIVDLFQGASLIIAVTVANRGQRVRRRASQREARRSILGRSTAPAGE